MKYCSKHHKNPDDAIFCNECREKLAQVKTNMKKCPTCKAENPTDADFCHECGHCLRFIAPDPPKPNDSIIKKIRESFVSNYKITERYILGIFVMWTFTLLSLISLYRFINSCKNESNWGLVYLAIVVSYVGTCYQKAFWRTVWVIAYIIIYLAIDLKILSIIIFSDEIGFSFWFDRYPIAATSVMIEIIGFPIVAYRMYDKKDSSWWD